MTIGLGAQIAIVILILILLPRFIVLILQAFSFAMRRITRFMEAYAVYLRQIDEDKKVTVMDLLSAARKALKGHPNIQ